jgi:NADH-ubiquinone oxidoreductase chain 4
LGWGYQPERVQVGIYLLLYTLLASLPFLVGSLFIYISLGSLCLFLLSANNSSVSNLYFRTVHIVIFILFKPTNALFLKHIHIHI